MRSVVLLHALVEGMGRKEGCELLAIRESLLEPNRIVFSRCSVIEAPPSLPDGDYMVSFKGYTVPAQKQAGLWLPNEGAASSCLTAATEPVGPSIPFRMEEIAEILPGLMTRVA